LATPRRHVQSRPSGGMQAVTGESPVILRSNRLDLAMIMPSSSSLPSGASVDSVPSWLAGCLLPVDTALPGRPQEQRRSAAAAAAAAASGSCGGPQGFDDESGDESRCRLSVAGVSRLCRAQRVLSALVASKPRLVRTQFCAGRAGSSRVVRSVGRDFG
jgi:hypothetical protein